jgi:hypothetical protein
MDSPESERNLLTSNVETVEERSPAVAVEMTRFWLVVGVQSRDGMDRLSVKDQNDSEDLDLNIIWKVVEAERRRVFSSWQRTAPATRWRSAAFMVAPERTGFFLISWRT